jgi:hypothetical protein
MLEVGVREEGEENPLGRRRRDGDIEGATLVVDLDCVVGCVWVGVVLLLTYCDSLGPVL